MAFAWPQQATGVCCELARICCQLRRATMVVRLAQATTVKCSAALYLGGLCSELASELTRLASLNKPNPADRFGERIEGKCAETRTPLFAHLLLPLRQLPQRATSGSVSLDSGGGSINFARSLTHDYRFAAAATAAKRGRQGHCEGDAAGEPPWQRTATTYRLAVGSRRKVADADCSPSCADPAERAEWQQTTVRAAPFNCVALLSPMAH